VRRLVDLATRRWWLTAVVLALVGFGLLQLVPIRVENPPVVAEPDWDSPRTRALAVAACFDCHSNESRPYWFERIAPLSWWIASHVREGRDALNFSEWGTRGQGEADDLVEVVRDGSMPPASYTWLGLHPDAQLTPKQRARLAEGLQRTLARSGGRGGGG
jgi:mono/diheme cytochrome c family protein